MYQSRAAHAAFCFYCCCNRREPSGRKRSRHIKSTNREAALPFLAAREAEGRVERTDRGTKRKREDGRCVVSGRGQASNGIVTHPTPLRRAFDIVSSIPTTIEAGTLLFSFCAVVRVRVCVCVCAWSSDYLAVATRRSARLLRQARTSIGARLLGGGRGAPSRTATADGARLSTKFQVKPGETRDWRAL